MAAKGQAVVQRIAKRRKMPLKSKQLARDLWKATKDGDVSKVTALLEQGADPNHELYWSEDWKKEKGLWLGIPPLHRACDNGNIDIARLLVVKGGANVYRSDGPYNRTPIHWACGGGSLEVVKYLVEVHCSVDVRDEDGQTPLHLACGYGHKDIVKYLVKERGCDTRYRLNVRDEDNRTPLHSACEGGHKDVVVYLVESKCDINVTDDFDKTPLDLATRRNEDLAMQEGYTEIVDYLISLAPLQRPGEQAMGSQHIPTLSQPSPPANQLQQEEITYNLTVELDELTEPIKFGILLKIPQNVLIGIEKSYPNDIDGQKRKLFEYIASNHKTRGITWTTIADALSKTRQGDLSLKIREKYC